VRFELDVNEVAKAIDVPADEWAGRCYEISCHIRDAKLVPEGSRAVYGKYDGPVAPGTLFFGKPYIAHGWLLLPDGLIVDPTRWVFEGEAPYIYVLDPCGCEMFDPDPDNGGLVCRLCDHIDEEHENTFMGVCRFSGLDYDEGANRWREENLTPPPPTGNDEVKLRLMLAPGPAAWISGLLKFPELEIPVPLTVAQAFWVANLPYHILGGHAPSVYRAFEKAHMQALIPLDNWMKMEAEAQVSA
jgi:hypothetical protein